MEMQNTFITVTNVRASEDREGYIAAAQVGALFELAAQLAKSNELKETELELLHAQVHATLDGAEHIAQHVAEVADTLDSIASSTEEQLGIYADVNNYVLDEDEDGDLIYVPESDVRINAAYRQGLEDADQAAHDAFSDDGNPHFGTTDTDNGDNSGLY